MDRAELINLARQWAVQVGVVDRAGQAVTHAKDTELRALRQENELHAALLAAAPGGCDIEVAGYRVTYTPGGVLQRVKQRGPRPWLPIATAPHDGCEVEIKDVTGEVTRARWDYAYSTRDAQADAWVLPDGTRLTATGHVATHWREV